MESASCGRYDRAVIPYIPWVIGGALTALVIHRARSPRLVKYPQPRPKAHGIPFALGDYAPLWPIKSSKNDRWLEVAYEDHSGEMHGNASRRFLATRPSKGPPTRYHTGVDLYANPGDIVVAPESGVVVGTQRFLPSIPGEDALLIRGYQGVTVLLGEMEAGSWKEFGVKDGVAVKKGQPVGRIGLNQAGGHMLHIETYSCCPTKNESWYIGKPRPDHVLDPSDYLLRARMSKAGVA